MSCLHLQYYNKHGESTTVVCNLEKTNSVTYSTLFTQTSPSRSPKYMYISSLNRCCKYKVHYSPGGGGGCTPLHKLYRYMYVPPQRVWFLSHFGLKTGIDFDHYGLKLGMVFKGTTGAYQRICLFNSK